MPQDESLKKVQSNSISLNVAMYVDGGGEGDVDICHENALSVSVWTARGPEVSCLHYLNRVALL